MKSARNFWLVAAAIFFAVTVPYGFAAYIYWPGKFMPDSLFQFEQAMKLKPLEDANPVTMALLMRLTSNFETHSTWYYGLQYLITIFCAAFGTSALVVTYLGQEKLLKQIGIGVVFALILTIWPTNFHLSSVVWRDAPFTWLCFAQVAALVCLFVLWKRRAASEDARALICLILLVLSGVIARHFRHNASSIIFPNFALGVFFFLKLRSESKLETRRKAVKVICCLLFGIVALASRGYLRSHFITTPEGLAGYSFDRVRMEVLKNDFRQAIGFGMPLTEEEKQRLDHLVFFDAMVATTDMVEPFYNTRIKFRIKGEESEREFLDIAEEIIKQHPFYWLKVKLVVIWEALYARHGYQAPNFIYDDYSERNYPINLNWDKDLETTRDGILWFLGRDKIGLSLGVPAIFKVLYWTFYPACFVYFCSFLIFLSSVKTTIRSRKLGLYKAAAQHLDFLAPIFCAITMAFPIMLLSAANSYRYYWGIELYAWIALFVMGCHSAQMRKIIGVQSSAML